MAEGLHWNSTNPIFRIDNTDHIVDVNSGNLPFEYDQLNIICPVAGHGRGTRGREDGERYIIYNVSKEEYGSSSSRSPSGVSVQHHVAWSSGLVKTTISSQPQADETCIEELEGAARRTT